MCYGTLPGHRRGRPPNVPPCSPSKSAKFADLHVHYRSSSNSICDELPVGLHIPPYRLDLSDNRTTNRTTEESDLCSGTEAAAGLLISRSLRGGLTLQLTNNNTTIQLPQNPATFRSNEVSQLATHQLVDVKTTAVATATAKPS